MNRETTPNNTAELAWLKNFTQEGAPAGSMACKQCGALVGWTGTGTLAKVHYDSHEGTALPQSLDDKLRHQLDPTARNQVQRAFTSDLVGGQPVTVEEIGDALFELYQDQAIRWPALNATLLKLVEEGAIVAVHGTVMRRLTLSRGQFPPVNAAENYYQRLEDHRRLRARVRDATPPQRPATGLFRRKWTCFLEQPGWKGGTPCTETAEHAVDLSDRGRCGWQWVADPVWADEAAQYGIGSGETHA